MKKSGKGILYLAIVVLVITIAILIGIIINLLNKNNVINKQEEGQEKQLTETTSDNAYVSATTHLLEVNEQETKLLNFKSAIATAITNEGITTSSTDTAETMASNIAGILKARTTLSEDIAATAENITEGKQAWVNGELITGNAANSSGTIKTANLGESADTHSWGWDGDTFTVNYSFSSIAGKTGLTAEEVESLINSGKMIAYTSNFRGRSTTDSCKWMQYLAASTTTTGVKASIFCSGFSEDDEITFYFNTYVAWIE